MAQNLHESESIVIRRDLCWLTDPLPPEVYNKTHNSFTAEWQPVRFCGISPTAVVDTVTYTLEVAEGMEYAGGINIYEPAEKT